MADEGDAKEEVKAIDEGAVASATAAMKEEVQSLVSSTAYLRAIQRAVHEPPNTKSDATKKVAAEAATLAINAVPAGDIDKIIDQLEVEDL